MIKGVIFDVDGTLIDSIGDIAYSANLALTQYGYEKQSEDFVRLNTGKGFRRLIADMLPEGTGDERIDEITKVYAEIYGQHYCERTKPYPGINELLLELQKRNIKMCVNSNKKDEYTKYLMSHIFPDINFTSVIGERKNIPNKPDPYTAHEMCRIMGLDIDEVLYIGDSEVDIKTAKNGNFKSVGCLWGFRGIKVLEEEAPDYMVSNPEEILKIIWTGD